MIIGGFVVNRRARGFGLTIEESVFNKNNGVIFVNDLNVHGT